MKNHDKLKYLENQIKQLHKNDLSKTDLSLDDD